MWKFKALIQFVFAHLPFGEWLNFMAQKTRGAYSDEAQIRSLLTQSRNLGLSNSRFLLEGKIALEIGSGWNGIGCLLLYLFGIARIYAYDHQSHMRIALLQQLVRLAGEQAARISDAMGLPVDRIQARLEKLQSCTDIQELHERMGVVYCAPGDAGKTGLPAASVDYIFSYGVLEHIPQDSLREIFNENKRLLAPEGRAYHNIGLHDHFHNAGLGNGVNFLRYPEWLWGFFCYNAILYHNRLRLPHYLELIEKSGLQVVWRDKELLQLNLDVLRGLKVDAAFAGLSDEDLAASHLYVDLALCPGHPCAPQIFPVSTVALFLARKLAMHKGIGVCSAHGIIISHLQGVM